MKLFGLRDGNGNKVYPEMAQDVEGISDSAY
jgi:hypothetical protein